MHDGVGALLRLALFGTTTNDSNVELDENDFEAFLLEATHLVGALQQSALNFAVIFSLFLTIFAALMASTEDDVQSESGAWLGDGVDAFTFAAGLGNAAQRIRRVFYVLELLVLTTGLAISCVGLYRSNFLFTAFSTGLPSVIAKCEYFVAAPYRFSDISSQFGAVIVFLLLSLSVTATRVCAIKALVLFVGGFCGYIRTGFRDTSTRDGAMGSLVFAQHREAQMLFQLNERGSRLDCVSDPAGAAHKPSSKLRSSAAPAWMRSWWQPATSRRPTGEGALL
jgi:hypothetical protein